MICNGWQYLVPPQKRKKIVEFCTSRIRYKWKRKWGEGPPRQKEKGGGGGENGNCHCACCRCLGHVWWWAWKTVLPCSAAAGGKNTRIRSLLRTGRGANLWFIVAELQSATEISRNYNRSNCQKKHCNFSPDFFAASFASPQFLLWTIARWVCFHSEFGFEFYFSSAPISFPPLFVWQVSCEKNENEGRRRGINLAGNTKPSFPHLGKKEEIRKRYLLFPQWKAPLFFS